MTDAAGGTVATRMMVVVYPILKDRHDLRPCLRPVASVGATFARVAESCEVWDAARARTSRTAANAQRPERGHLSALRSQ